MDAAEFWAVGDYSVVGDLWSQPGEDLADALEPAGADVIDLATGTGVTAIAMADRGARSVTGVDITASLLDEARRRALAAGHDLTFVRSDMSSTPLPTASADIVSSTVGLVFADDPQVALAEARRLTRPGGVVALTSWAGGGFFDRIRKALAPYFPE
ncbi:MAG: class I SAM-dependent methyltransferase, partial [Brevibacterium linens]